MNRRLIIKARHKQWHSLNFIFPSGKWNRRLLLWPQRSANGKYYTGHLECTKCSGYGYEYRYWDTNYDQETKYYKPQYDAAGIEIADTYKCRIQTAK